MQNTKRHGLKFEEHLEQTGASDFHQVCFLHDDS